MPLEIGAHSTCCGAPPDVAALTAFFDRHNFGPMLRRQAERLALLLAAPPDLFDVVVRLLLGTFTLPPIDSCSIEPELSSLTVKLPLTRPA